MKNIFYLLCAFLLIVSLAGCSQSSAVATDSTDMLAEKGLALTQLMDEMAQSEEYRELLSSSAPLSSLMAQIGSSDYKTPKAIYQVILPQNIDRSYLAELQLADMPESIQKVVNNRLVASFPTMIASSYGAQTIAAISCLTTEENFIYKDAPGNVIYFFLYDQAYSSAVVFQGFKDDIMTANAYFIPSEAFGETASPEVISGLFSDILFLQDVNVTEISLS